MTLKATGREVGRCEHEQEHARGALVYDRLDAAIVAIGWQHPNPVVVYDEDKAIEVLRADFEKACGCEGMGDCDHVGEAIEFFDFNVRLAYVGEGTPVFVKMEACDEC